MYSIPMVPRIALGCTLSANVKQCLRLLLRKVARAPRERKPERSLHRGVQKSSIASQKRYASVAGKGKAAKGASGSPCWHHLRLGTIVDTGDLGARPITSSTVVIVCNGTSKSLKDLIQSLQDISQTRPMSRSAVRTVVCIWNLTDVLCSSWQKLRALVRDR